ncbi:unnamed protein product [Zymoseptoria tritici ST99CH_3D1]|nr:unnamed protein product [Zymoseptoria tritici ST99CH_3D1]
MLGLGDRVGKPRGAAFGKQPALGECGMMESGMYGGMAEVAYDGILDGQYAGRRRAGLFIGDESARKLAVKECALGGCMSEGMPKEESAGICGGTVEDEDSGSSDDSCESDHSIGPGH